MNLARRLERLPHLRRSELPAAAPPAPPPPSEAAPFRPPTLDELRDRIAAILGRDPPPRPVRERPPPSPGSVFARLETASGPLDIARKPTLPGHRIGSIPLSAARTADPALLALFALDPELAACAVEGALYVDTETTGLSSGAGTVAFLVGLAFFDPREGAFVLEQLLLRELGDEVPLLRHLAERFEAASMLVTFNGKSFDLPVLRTRMVMNRLAPLAERPHLDLLHLARRLHKHRLSSCTLGSIEDRVLGRARVGDVSGADIAAIYHHYLRTGDADALAPVVEHNALDVLSMIALVGLYGEPLEAWVPSVTAGDLAAASCVARRGGDLGRAVELADASVRLGAGAAGHRARADVAKARGDKAVALEAYEAALEAAGDDDPVADALRLELAKLYEHHAKAYERAIAVLARGTLETEAAREKRLARLARKALGPAPESARRAISIRPR